MRDPRDQLYVVARTGMSVYGMILALPGTVIGLPEFAARFDLSLADRGTFIAALFGGVLAGSIASGPVVTRAGYRRAVCGSTASLAFLLPSFAFASSRELALFTLVALGFASATLNTAANALSSDLFPEEPARRMTGLALAFGIGGLLMPAATAAASPIVSWRVIVVAGAAVSAVTALAGVRTRPVAMPAHDGEPLRAARRFLQQRGFVLVSVLLVCAAANEVSFAGWTSTYLIASGFTPAQATWGLSSHWLGLVTGRFLFAGRVDRDKVAAITRSAAGGALVMLLMLVVPVPPILATGPYLGGVSIAVIFATSLALAGERYRGNRGTLFGVLLAIAQLGGLILPPLIGAVGQIAGLRTGLALVVVNGMAIAWLARAAAAHASGVSSQGAT